jgi:hypothetical protein
MAAIGRGKDPSPSPCGRGRGRGVVRPRAFPAAEATERWTPPPISLSQEEGEEFFFRPAGV